MSRGGRSKRRRNPRDDGGEWDRGLRSRCRLRLESGPGGRASLGHDRLGTALENRCDHGRFRFRGAQRFDSLLASAPGRGCSATHRLDELAPVGADWSEELAEIELVIMPSTGSLRGRVVSKSGAGVSRAHVRVDIDPASHESGLVMRGPLTVWTDIDGHYLLDSLPTGTNLSLIAAAPGSTLGAGSVRLEEGRTERLDLAHGQLHREPNALLRRHVRTPSRDLLLRSPHVGARTRPHSICGQRNLRGHRRTRAGLAQDRAQRVRGVHGAGTCVASHSAQRRIRN